MKRYEQAIRVITGFFAVLLGFGLKNLLDNADFTPVNARWPCFSMSVFLFLRLLLGSGNHMWFEFVRRDLAQDSEYKAPRIQILSDFLFLVVFGLIGAAICYSKNLEHFLALNLLLTGVGLTWVVGYAGIGVFRSKVLNRTSSIPQGNWNFWGWVNLVQFTSILVVQCLIIPRNWGPVPWWPSFLGTPAWDWALLILVVIYLLILIFDFSMQLKNLEKNLEKAKTS